MVSLYFDNEDEIRADQDIAIELKEYITSVFSKGDNMEHKDGHRITRENGNDHIWRKRKLIQS